MNASKADLQDWLIDALKAQDGKATVVEVCRHVWEAHKDELRASGDLFYTWQYDIRWAATRLRGKGVLGPAQKGRAGAWTLGVGQ